jgi:high frequency lysogenization protein
MKQTDANKTLALAGIFQAAHLINQVAFNGDLSENAYHSSLQSIFSVNPADVPSVFNGLTGVRVGLAYVIRYGTKKPPFKEHILLRYLLHMTELAKQVLKNPALFKHLQRRLQPIISQATHLGLTHDIVITELATLYRQVFLGRRLQIPVRGKLSSLKKTEVVNKIYALLVAGIRAAVLWYQVGGNRWQLLFLRRKLRDHADILLRHECPG